MAGRRVFDLPVGPVMGRILMMGEFARWPMQPGWVNLARSVEMGPKL